MKNNEGTDFFAEMLHAYVDGDVSARFSKPFEIMLLMCGKTGHYCLLFNKIF